MIAKRITSKAASSRVARLVKYVVAAQGGIDPRSWTRTADYMLASKTNEYGEKVGAVRVTNCNTDDPAAATTLIEATQAANTRSKTDKTYHLVFSFPPGEEPSLDVLRKIEDQLVEAIGYKDHQRISAVHIDTDHLHVHVAINKVHPVGFQNIEPYYDKIKLMETCERLELEHGLTRTNHGLTGERTKREREATIEAQSGVETLTGFVSREIAPAMREAKDWNELHDALVEHGLSIKKRGAGLVIGSGELWARASQCDREFSLKALTDRLGPFQQSVRPASRAYTPRPTQSHHSTSRLYDQYQRERQARKAAKQNGMAALKQESAALNAQLQRWRVAQRMLVKATMKGPSRRAALKLIKLQTTVARNNNKRALTQKRHKVMAATATPAWLEWLTHQAQNGNAEALAVLRNRGIHVSGNVLTAKAGTGKNGILKDSRPIVTRNGSAIYNAQDGGVVVDRKNQVQALKTTAGSSLIALELASKRFSGHALVVEGQDSFKAEVARLAGEQGIGVRFADKEMEQARVAASASRPKRRTRSNDRGMEL